MAKIDYPGDVADGEDITAALFNSYMQLIFRTLGATSIGGADGITDDEIDATLSPDKITGTAMVLDGDQTITGDQTFSGDVITTPTRVDSAGADNYRPSVAQIPLLVITNQAAADPATLTGLTGGVNGKVVDVIFAPDSVSNITVEHGTDTDDIFIGDQANLTGFASATGNIINLRLVFLTAATSGLANDLWFVLTPEA